MNRIVVIGIAGAGKTTVARRLAAALDLPHLELDAVYHRPGWEPASPADFAAAVTEHVAGERWVVDGNYTSRGVDDLVWPRADTIVWLDLPRRTVMRRIIARTLRRVLTREELWNTNRESFANLYAWEPEKNIVRWAWTRFPATRSRYERHDAAGTWNHAQVVRLRTPREVRAFLESVEA